MRFLFTLLTAFAVLLSSNPVLAEGIFTLPFKDTKDKQTYTFEFRTNGGVLEFKRQGEEKWIALGIEQGAGDQKNILELFKIRDRLFYVYTSQDRPGVLVPHVGEVVFRPANSLVGPAFAAGGVIGMLVGALLIQTDLMIIRHFGAGTVLTGMCAFLAGVITTGTPSTTYRVKDANPRCGSPDQDAKWGKASLHRVIKNADGKIVDVEISLAPSMFKAAQPTSLRVLLNAVGCEDIMNPDGTVQQASALK